ncbi:agamous-like MADS-box protein AGL80 [Pyrus x bretschneideri]|uniref:agamous-like MADS-box protein AGL80 n=1 Tax=Pyrus x bretschneideri TaxID=225117 RepID=UPI00202DE80A|nr:agamous-like MADS-box protein AGL80 [Pyrus x bretschneideri]
MQLPEGTCCFFVFSTMAKNRTKRELISHEPSRRATFKNRKASFFRKLNEITTLCGVIACAVIYNPSDTKTDVWPSPQEAFYVLEKFRNLSEERRGKFMVDQESFLKNNISKLNRQLERARFKNQELDEKLLLIEYLEGKNFLDPGRLESLNGLDQQLDKRIDFITNRIEFLEGLRGNQVDAELDSDGMAVRGIKGGVVGDNQG